MEVWVSASPQLWEDLLCRTLPAKPYDSVAPSGPDDVLIVTPDRLLKDWRARLVVVGGETGTTMRVVDFDREEHIEVTSFLQLRAIVDRLRATTTDVDDELDS